jgi:hypothetical protein
MRDGHRDEGRTLLREAVAAQPENKLALRELGYTLIAETMQPPTPEIAGRQSGAGGR